jgi:FAD/FMN-containing dehydrogenase
MLTTDQITTSDVRDFLVSPGDADWDAVRRTFNLLHDQRPVAIAMPGNEREVAAAVRYAAERGLSVTARATGDNATPSQNPSSSPRRSRPRSRR